MKMTVQSHLFSRLRMSGAVSLTHPYNFMTQRKNLPLDFYIKTVSTLNYISPINPKLSQWIRQISDTEYHIPVMLLMGQARF